MNPAIAAAAAALTFYAIAQLVQAVRGESNARLFIAMFVIAAAAALTTI